MTKQISANLDDITYGKIKAWGLPWRRIIMDGVAFKDLELEVAILKAQIEQLKKANIRLQNALLMAQGEKDVLEERKP